MKNTRNLKIAGGAAAALALVIVLALVLAGHGKGEGSYRDISIFELASSATVTRGDTSLDAYEGMRLEDGDRIQVAEDGYLRLVLDGDKYATLEAGTEICLNATGDSENSRTEIVLINGAVLNEIDNKLNADSSYELSTPTSVMAVRGTVFRVALSTEGEASHTELIVLDGQVSAAPILADGTVGEALLAAPGTAVTFDRQDGHSDPVCTQSKIDYTALPADTLRSILELRQSGRLEELPVTAEELARLQETEKTASSPSQEPSAPQESAPQVQTPVTETPSAAAPAHPSVTKPSGNDTRVTSSETAGAKPGEQETSSQTDEPNEPEESDEADTPDGPDETGEPSGSHPTDRPDQGFDTAVYTVTFLDAEGNLFGIQRVAAGAVAQRPLLSPVEGSDWCDAEGNVYDFATAVTSDLTLYYR